jgi:hypothetical protein
VIGQVPGRVNHHALKALGPERRAENVPTYCFIILRIVEVELDVPYV